MNTVTKNRCLSFWAPGIILLFTANASAWGEENEFFNMRLVGEHHLQARSSYQPIPHKYGDQWILFVGHHAGESLNSQTGEVEVNGMSIVNVTDPTTPEL